MSTVIYLLKAAGIAVVAFLLIVTAIFAAGGVYVLIIRAAEYVSENGIDPNNLSLVLIIIAVISIVIGLLTARLGENY